jgi:major histocompatibility complex class I
MYTLALLEVEEDAESLRTGVIQAVVAHAFNPSTWEAEAGGFLRSRPAWSTE